MMKMMGAGGKKSTGKDALIARVKQFQKSSEENKQAWYSFCDEQGVGKYDPSYYEPNALKTFLGGVGEGGFAASANFSSEKSKLIAKVKQFQKSSADNKQTWYTFCDSQPV